MLQEEFDTPVPARGFSRRELLPASGGGGFAAALLPLAAQTRLNAARNGQGAA